MTTLSPKCSPRWVAQGTSLGGRSRRWAGAECNCRLNLGWHRGRLMGNMLEKYQTLCATAQRPRGMRCSRRGLVCYPRR